MDMDVPLLQTHRDSAEALFRQRGQWRQAEGISSRSLQRLEQRLRLHLHVLARVPPEADAPEPSDPAAAFVRLAAALQGANSEQRNAAASRALEWLGGEVPPLRDAAFHALALYPVPEAIEETRRAWEDTPGLRTALVDIWRIQGTSVPRGLLNQGELHAHDAALQAAVLRYSADWPEAGLSVFRPYYHALTDDPFARIAEHGLLAEALRGGLLRGDADAALALRRAIEQQAGPEEAAPLLRLAALSGAADFHPILQQHARNEPESGYRLLALWGRREAVDDLLEGLESPRDNAPAAVAWQLLTGQRLPRRPRMQVVGEQEPEAATGESIADSEAARRWWSATRESWAPEERRLLGRPLSAATPLAWLADEAGAPAADALDLLGLQLGRPVGVAPETWILRRQECLASLDISEPAAPQVAHA